MSVFVGEENLLYGGGQHLRLYLREESKPLYSSKKHGRRKGEGGREGGIRKFNINRAGARASLATDR